MQYVIYLMLLVFSHAAPFNNTDPTGLTTVGSIPLPQGFYRMAQPASSFGSWLRSLPLKTDNTVYLFNGLPKLNQSAQYAVINISLNNKDLQQCADAVIRLKAEYHYYRKDYDKIKFHTTDGTLLDYASWRKGYRFHLQKGRLVKVLATKPSTDSASFKQYLDLVFSYAGTLSLQKELYPVTSLKNIIPGDVFIQGGSPGHAVIVVDVAQNARGERLFLLAQSYMPAQDIHILRNPAHSLIPWYAAGEHTDLLTPEWYFRNNCLRRFPD